MMAYNVADLERELIAGGWRVEAAGLVSHHAVPGQVQVRGYSVVLISPAGASFRGHGPTRTDALRTAAEDAGVITPGQPHLQ